MDKIDVLIEQIEGFRRQKVKLTFELQHELDQARALSGELREGGLCLACVFVSADKK